MNDAASTLTLQDIADLARVRRPVVTMWRKRPMVRGQHLPFPAPVIVAGGIERFDRGQIVDWLERTGRGKNSDHRFDAAARAVPDGADLEDLVTLLCLYAQTGEELAGTTHQERVVLAEEVDASDAYLLREIRDGAPSTSTLHYVDELVETSFGATDALARLEASRIVRERAARELTSQVLEMLRAAVRACARHFDADSAALVCSDPALALALAGEFTQLVVAGFDDAARSIRRRAAIRGIHVTGHPAGPCVQIVSLLGQTVEQALDRVDETVLELGPMDIAMILGPASVLCDGLRGEPEQRRAQSLRTGGLVMALRLPRGLWREAYRQSLGLWVCRGSARMERPRIADLAALAATELDVSDLTADVAGALAKTETRAYRYARRAELALMLAGVPVVPRGVRVPRLLEPGVRSLDRIHTATLTTSRHLQPFDLFAAPATSEVRAQRRSLGEMEADGRLVIKRGSRINPDHGDVNGTVRVLPVGDLKLDAIDAAHVYPRANRTEPGDVVFVEKPEPDAWVDEIGGSLVASPARIIRLKTTAGVGPHLLAASISNLAAAGTEWQTWSVPELPADEIERLERVLTSINAYEANLRRRTKAADELKRALIEGIAAGVVTLETEPGEIPEYTREED